MIARKRVLVQIEHECSYHETSLVMAQPQTIAPVLPEDHLHGQLSQNMNQTLMLPNEIFTAVPLHSYASLESLKSQKKVVWLDDYFFVFCFRPLSPGNTRKRVPSIKTFIT